MTAITVLLYSPCFQQDQHDLTKGMPTDYDRKPVLSSLPAMTKKIGLGPKRSNGVITAQSDHVLTRNQPCLHPLQDGGINLGLAYCRKIPFKRT